ncbi:MAG: hypothetical protein D6784_11045, partial [Chloroflexi bacterium]
FLLTAPTPRTRLLAVLETPTLRRTSLLAAPGNLPWQTATLLTTTPAGTLLTIESGAWWEIDPAAGTVTTNDE